jgi:hypothetical protein
MALMTQKSEFRQIQPGSYICIIQSIVPKTIPDGKGGESQGAEWKFAIASEGPHYGDIAEAFTSLAWSPKSKCYEWATSLLGYAPDPEEPIDLEMFLGLECCIIVSTNPKRPERTRIAAIQRVIREAAPALPGRSNRAPVAPSPAAPLPHDTSRARIPKALAAQPPVSSDDEDLDF